jgi:hypothetical protein
MTTVDVLGKRGRVDQRGRGSVDAAVGLVIDPSQKSRIVNGLSPTPTAMGVGLRSRRFWRSRVATRSVSENFSPPDVKPLV